MSSRFRRRLLRPLDWRFRHLREILLAVMGETAAAAREADEVQLTALAALDARVDALQAAVAQLRETTTAAADRVEAALQRTESMTRAVAAEESANRRRLWALREDPGYEAAYGDEPLVTVSVVTRDRVGLLMERSLSSILGQSYERLQVVVVGDDATPELARAVRSLPDPRVSFVNLTSRVVRDRPELHWLAAGTLPRNEAYRLTEGSWTLDFDDDDALRPTAVETLLELARTERPEVAYGTYDQHAPDGSVTNHGAFPPRRYEFSLAAALVHAGLRFFAREGHAADLGIPGDWYRTERMVRAGVRFAQVERPIFDYYPTTLWAPHSADPPR